MDYISLNRVAPKIREGREGASENVFHVLLKPQVSENYFYDEHTDLHTEGWREREREKRGVREGTGGSLCPTVKNDMKTFFLLRASPVFQAAPGPQHWLWSLEIHKSQRH